MKYFIKHVVFLGVFCKIYIYLETCENGLICGENLKIFVFVSFFIESPLRMSHKKR